MELFLTSQYLRTHPNEIFVFGDNLERQGYGGAATLRDETNTYGFVTKKFPDHQNDSYYKPDEYEKVFYHEVATLVAIIKENPDKTYLISKLGAGLANKFEIYEKIIQPKIRILLKDLPNVRFLYDPEDDLVKQWWGYVTADGNLHIKEAPLPRFAPDNAIEYKPYLVSASTTEEALNKLAALYVPTGNELTRIK